MVNPCDFLQKWVRRGTWLINTKVKQRNENDNAESGSQIKHKWHHGINSHSWYAATELSKGKLISINE